MFELFWIRKTTKKNAPTRIFFHLSKSNNSAIKMKYFLAERHANKKKILWINYKKKKEAK